MKRSPIKGMSKKAQARAAAWRKVRFEVIVRDQDCQARNLLPGACWGKDHIHHLRRRSQGGQDTPENCVLVCEIHHQAIHDNVERAAELGLLILRPDAQDGAA